MSERYELTGPVEYIGETETFGAKGFRKRIIVLTEGDKYPQSVPFEFVQDSTDKLDGVMVGEVVTIAFNLRGREYNGKYYGSLQGWRIDRVRGAGESSPSVDSGGEYDQTTGRDHDGNPADAFPNDGREGGDDEPDF